MEGVYLVEWIDGFERGVLGIFSSRVKADNAIKEDEKRFPFPEFNTDYEVQYYGLDEVQE